MDADAIIKAAKESWAFPGTEGQVACRSCLKPVTVWGQDINGDPIYDSICPDCVGKAVMRRLKAGSVPPTVFAPREHCNRCYDAKPLAGMAWCGPCAIAYNETFRGKEDDALIDARVRGFRDRMVGLIPG